MEVGGVGLATFVQLPVINTVMGLFRIEIQYRRIIYNIPAALTAKAELGPRLGGAALEVVDELFNSWRSGNTEFMSKFVF